MSEWRVWYSFKGTHRTSRGFATKQEALKFATDVIVEGGSIRNLKYKEKNVSAESTLRFLSAAGIYLQHRDQKKTA